MYVCISDYWIMLVMEQFKVLAATYTYSILIPYYLQ